MRLISNINSSIDIIFRSFDPQNTGVISEKRFVQIMQAKESISDEDINDMIQEYKCLYVSEEKETINDDEDCQIVYKGK